MHNQRRVKKLLYQFLRQQLPLAKGDHGEIFQLRSRQKLRRGPLPNLVLRTMVEQGVRYLILLHFVNFVTVYFADPTGSIVAVKNFDRKHDQQVLAELPRMAKRILVYPQEKKVPDKHKQLLKQIKTLQKQFHTQIRAIEKITSLHLPPRNIPGIALTPQDQEDVLYIPEKMRTPPYLGRFFLREAWRLFIPTIFKPYSDLMVPFLIYLDTEDPTERIELFHTFPVPLKATLEQIPTKSLTKQQIRSLLSILRWWARYEDRSLDTETFLLLLIDVLTQLTRRPADSQMAIVAALSMQLFQRQGDVRDFLRSVCALILSDTSPLVQKYWEPEVFQLEEEIPQICRAMVTRRFRPLYQTPLALFQSNANRKLARLFHQAFDHLKAQILRIEHEGVHLKLINQSDLELSNVTIRYPVSDRQEVIEVIPCLRPDQEYEVLLSEDLESEQIIAEFTDAFHHSYSHLISVQISDDCSTDTA